MTALLRSGVDLVDVLRVADLVTAGGAGFVDNVWTTAEQDYCGQRAEQLAGRWAAKEAAMKALGVGFPDVSFLDIEVFGETGKAPLLRLRGAAAATAGTLGLTTWSVSISHERDLAVAFVIATGTMEP
ncbi:holo-ACP synthase [Amycolatopsis sp., V23-08]|uniref:Holo-[acyl-carrier-protein] synthase n=1 Tax=Amycolatopsis heterodermiae TaxID=3110235 RepID=A0ABU5QWJ2_9PSEU|nr:holo-ACP synthase [Amycolatopsis sp., V23-08]MEA5358290.1 holo-ACP synthase [Amycolatopsis sp., V23-08]